LENLPLNYDFEQVMSVSPDRTLDGNYSSLKQELLKTPGIQDVSGGDHVIGEGCSGQKIALLENRTNQLSINEYRIIPGLCKLMRFQLVEGAFLKENLPEDSPQILINQSTVKLLELQSPVTGQHVLYKDTEVEIAGVVKDFIYGEPADPIQPLVLSNCFEADKPSEVYIRFDKNINRATAQALAQKVFQQFDSAFILNPEWSEDIYLKKFDGVKTQSKLVSIACLLSVFIAMTGLLAIHLYTAVRRTKEIGIRRINGANPWEIFALLSGNIVKWVILAGIIALPVAYYVASDWLNNYANHTPLGWAVFVLPVLIQCLVAIVTTSGVSLNVLSRNPVEALKSE
jgi:putative ABC transport system permease protein